MLCKVLVISLFILVAGCSQKDEDDAVRLAEIETKVEALFNEEKTDLTADLSQSQLDEVEALIDAEEKSQFNEANEQTMQQINLDYTLAHRMYELDQAINDWFEDDILKESVTTEQIDKKKESLKVFEEEKVNVFIERQTKRIEAAKTQLQVIEQATKLVLNLFTQDDEVKTNVTRDEEKKALESVEQIKHQTIKEDLLKKLEQVDQAMTKAEEAQRKAEEERRKEEEKRQQASTSIGNFAGYYLAEDGLLCELTATSFYCFMPFSDVIFDSPIDEIISNTGTELTVRSEGGVYTWKLLHNGQTLQTAETMQRITKEEYDRRRTTLD